MSGILVTSLYGGQLRTPLVQITVEDQPAVQCSPEEARAVALNLLQAAEAAEQDAFMFEFAAKRTGDPVAGVALLGTYREWREQARKETSS